MDKVFTSSSEDHKIPQPFVAGGPLAYSLTHVNHSDTSQPWVPVSCIYIEENPLFSQCVLRCLAT